MGDKSQSLIRYESDSTGHKQAPIWKADVGGRELHVQHGPDKEHRAAAECLLQGSVHLQ